MFAPFGWCSRFSGDAIILRLFGFRKFTIPLMRKIEHGFCELRKLGLRCAVGCLCEHIEGLRRVELAQKREILRVKIAGAVGVFDVVVARGDAGLGVLRDAVDRERGLLATGRAVEGLMRDDGVAVELVRAVFRRDPARGGVGIDAGLRGKGRGRDRERRQASEQQGDGFSEMVCEFHLLTSKNFVWRA